MSGGDDRVRRDARPVSGSSATGVRVRPVREPDVAALWELMRAFAVFERLEQEFTGSAEALGRHFRGEAWPRLDGFLAEVDGELAGFAICFGTISTFWVRPFMYLEDLFVLERFRGRGVGRALIAAVAALAVERNCARMDWAVLDWNQPAIGFYENLGARRSTGWYAYRIDGEPLRRLAAEADSTQE